MRYAMICETPYQLFNILNFVYTETNENDELDLFVNTVNRGMLEFYGRIKNNKRFNSVFSFTSPQKKDGKIIYMYRRFLEYFCPKASLNYSLSERLHNTDKMYDVIIIAFPNPLIVNFCQIYSDAEIWFIEDGTGSYHGKIGHAISSKISRIINPILHKGAEYISPTKLYVYKPEICKAEYSGLKISKLTALDANSPNYKYIENIFGTTEVTNPSKLTYISQPIKMGKYTEEERKVFSSVWEYKSDLQVRIHPTESTKDYAEFNGILIDSGINQWEMKCAKNITNDSILIGTCSTAQITPKLIYDIEPYIIFTLNIYSNVLPEDLSERLRQLIDDVQSLYKNKNKVLIPSSIDELIEIIKNIESEKMML